MLLFDKDIVYNRSHSKNDKINEQISQDLFLSSKWLRRTYETTKIPTLGINKSGTTQYSTCNTTGQR